MHPVSIVDTVAGIREGAQSYAANYRPSSGGWQGDSTQILGARTHPGGPSRCGALAFGRMAPRARFTTEEAEATGAHIGIDWTTSRFDVEQFRMGMDVELEHGTHEPDTNVTDDDIEMTAKLARAHLNEFPDYYTRLAAMEADAEAYWESRDR